MIDYRPSFTSKLSYVYLVSKNISFRFMQTFIFNHSKSDRQNLKMGAHRTCGGKTLMGLWPPYILRLFAQGLPPAGFIHSIRSGCIRIEPCKTRRNYLPYFGGDVKCTFYHLLLQKSHCKQTHTSLSLNIQFFFCSKTGYYKFSLSKSKKSDVFT